MWPFGPPSSSNNTPQIFLRLQLWERCMEASKRIQQNSHGFETCCTSERVRLTTVYGIWYTGCHIILWGVRGGSSQRDILSLFTLLHLVILYLTFALHLRHKMATHTVMFFCTLPSLRSKYRDAASNVKVSPGGAPTREECIAWRMKRSLLSIYHHHALTSVSTLSPRLSKVIFYLLMIHKKTIWKANT